jgi:hypothetical protein
MRFRAAQALLASVVLVAAAGCGGATSHSTGERDHAAGERDRPGGHEAKVEVRDPDQGGKPGKNPNKEAFEDRALPRGFVTAEDVRSARRAFVDLPDQLGVSDFQPGTTTQEARDRGRIRDPWEFLGPTVGFAPGPTTESLRDSITSGRITALAIDPNCGAGSGCRVWVAARRTGSTRSRPGAR